MPLKPGSSRKVVSTNIREMRASGHPQNQAIAAALRLARQGKAAGGEVTDEAPATFRARFAGKAQDQHPSESAFNKMPMSGMIDDRRNEHSPEMEHELDQRAAADMARQYAAQRMRNKYFFRPGKDIPQYAYGGDVGGNQAGAQVGGSTGGKGSIASSLLQRAVSGIGSGQSSGNQDWMLGPMGLVSQLTNNGHGGQAQTGGPPSGTANPFSPAPAPTAMPAPTPPAQMGGQGPTCPGSYAEGGEVDDLPPVSMSDVSRDVPGYWDVLGKEGAPRDQLLRPESPDAGAPLRQAIPRIPRAIAPDAMSLALGEDGEPLPQIEGKPPGKVKSFEDKRYMGAAGELAGIASLASPAGVMSTGARMAARAAPRLAESSIPMAGRSTPALAAEATMGGAGSSSVRNPVVGMATGMGASMAGATEAKGEEPEEPRIAELEGRIKTYMGQLDVLANKKYLTAAENQQVDALDKKITKLENDAAIYSRRGDVGSKAKQIELDRLRGLADTERGARTAITGQDEARRKTEREQINSQVTALRGEKTPLETAMFNRKNQASENQAKADQPFRQKYPGTSAAISGIGSAASGAFPYLTRMQRLGSGNRFVRDWQGYVDKAEGAITSRDTNAARLYTNQLKGFPEQAAKRDKPMSALGKTGVAAATGFNAALPLEAAVLPEQLDMAFGTPKAKEAAWSNFLDPWRVPAALATGVALTGAGLEAPLPRKALDRPEAASEGAIKGYAALAKEEKAAAKEEKAAAAVKRKGKARTRKTPAFGGRMYADGGEVEGGLGNADEIAGLRAAIEEENQRTQRAGTGLRYKREFENEHRASPYVNQIERSGNRIESLSDRLEALLPNPLLGSSKEEPPYVPQGPEAPPSQEAIVDAPGRQRDYWDSAKKIMFGDPDAMVDTRLKALNHPPSSWSPDERDYISGGVTQASMLASPSGLVLRGPAAARGLGAAAGRPPGNPTGSMLNASSMGGGPSAAPRSAPRGGPTARDPGPVPTGPWNPPPGSALAPAAGRTVRGTMIPVERVGGRYQSLNKDRPPREPRDPNAMPTQRRLPGPGRMDTLAAGGPAQSPWFSRDEARHMDDKITGPLAGPGGGRTDRLPISVPSGSYVVPADIVSGLGQGNTANGMQAMQKMFFSSGPYGTPLMRGARGRGPPRPPRPMKFADGGGVPIMAADGEFIVPPEKVVEIGGGDMDHGHNVLDHFVKLMRQQTIKTLSKLPDPQV